MQQWVQDHSTLLALLIPAIINLVADLWTRWFGSKSEQELEQRSEFWAGVAHIFRGGGIDVVRVLQGVGQILLSVVSKSKTIGPPVVLLIGSTGAVVGASSCTSWTRQDTKNVVEMVRVIAEEVCSPGNPTLDACVDRLLADPRVASARDRTSPSDMGSEGSSPIPSTTPSIRPRSSPRDEPEAPRSP